MPKKAKNEIKRLEKKLKTELKCVINFPASISLNVQYQILNGIYTKLRNNPSYIKKLSKMTVQTINIDFLSTEILELKIKVLSRKAAKYLQKNVAYRVSSLIYYLF